MYTRAIHIYPQDEAHVLHCDYPQSLGAEPGMPRCLCSCEPRYEEAEDGQIIIRHNSFDGREGLRWFNDVLGTKPAFAT